METLESRVVKGYELRERIGEGGFGAVYRATQSLIGREVAIKIILPQYANRPEFIRRFETEAQLVARLEHPYIVPLYDYWREPSGAYLVMRWLRGGSLHDSIEKNGPWSPRAAAQLLTHIGEALAVAHRQGVIHRDLKLENILLDENGNPYLTDFGIAKDLGGQSITQNDAIMGSPAYLSPEQIKGETVTPRSDIYALGIMIYEMLTGELPFDVPTPAALLYKHLTEPLPDLSEVRPGLAPAINAVIQRATAKDPADRYPDVLALVTEFRRAAKSDTTDDDEGGTLIITSTEITAPDPENPYKGLRAFQQADTADFFGRTTLTDRLLDRLGEQTDDARFLAVVGPSGSGKSSVVKAGVIPAIRRGGLAGSENWFVVEMVPGTDPMEELEAALLRVAVNPPASLLAQLNEDDRGFVRSVKRVLPDDESELLLLVDQFEEVFTLVEEEPRRALFMESLLAAASDPRSRIRVIITLRADFYDRPLNYVRFGDLMRRRTEVVLPLNDEELELAVVGPAQRAGIGLESGLVPAIVNEIRDQPGTLPLLQYALTELFERRRGRTLTLEAYDEIGGTLGALAQRADELYDGLGEEGEDAARQMFLRLVTLGEGAEDTRRRAFQAELLAIGSDRDLMQGVIEAFGRYRLLTFDHDPTTRSSTVEVAHEALIRRWGRLREWLDASRDDLRTQRRLMAAAEDWFVSGKDASFLLRGARLDQFEEWRATSSLAITTQEAEFLQASIAERERLLAVERERLQREEALEKRSRDVLRALVGVMTVAAVIALVLAGIAFTQRQAAQESRREAEAAQRAAEASDLESRALALGANARTALIENNPSLALSLAIRASESYDNVPVEVTRVLADAAYGPGVRFRLEGHRESVLDASFSPDGSFAASASADGTVRVWDTSTGQESRRIVVDDVVLTSVVFAGDGESLFVGATDGLVYHFGSVSGDELGRLAGHDGAVTSLAITPDGTRLVSGSLDRTLRVWDLVSGETLEVLEGHTGVVLAVDISADGRRVASSSGDAFLTDRADDEVDRTVRLWDVETGEARWQFTPGRGYVRTVALNADASSVLLGTWGAADGGVLTLLDASSGVVLRRFYGHTDIVSGVDFSPDGGRIASTSWDRTLRLWDTQTGVMLTRFVGYNDRFLGVAFSPDGQYLLATSGNIGGNEIELARDASQDTSVWLFDLMTRSQSGMISGFDDWVWSLAVSDDGQRLVTGSGPLRMPDDGSTPDTAVRLWDIATQDLLLTMTGHTNTVEGVAISPEGTRIVSGGWDRYVILWDAQTGEEIRRFGTNEGSHADRVNSVAFSPDGTRVASSSADGAIILWAVETGEEIRRFTGHAGEVPKIAFSPDGESLASSGYDDTLRLWDVATGEEIRRFGEDGIAHSNNLNDVAFSPDGRYLASTSWDTTVAIWDAASGELLHRLEGHTSRATGVAFSPDSTLILSGSSDTTVRLWDVASGQELQRFTGHRDWISELEFTPDGMSAVSAGQDNTVRQWLIARTADQLIDWAEANRYVRGLTCGEREQYRITPLCDS
jgi:WD40 repeat protein/serine/threonine protein kinase